MSNLERPSLADPIVRAALGSVPVVGAALAGLYDLGRELDQRRIQQMAAEARAAVGDDALLALKLQEDERFIDLLVVAVEAARRTSWDGTRITMGRLLGHALTDDADIDEDAALIVALAALEGPHFKFLATLEAYDFTELPQPDPTPPEPYKSALISQGVCALPFAGGMSFSTRGMAIPRVTPFGQRLLTWIREGEAATRKQSDLDSPPA
jgi:hypothetical protein